MEYPRLLFKRQEIWEMKNPIGIRSRWVEGEQAGETLFFYKRQHNLNIGFARIFKPLAPMCLYVSASIPLTTEKLIDN